MKKALSVVLAMLMVFSMVGVMAFATDETATETKYVTYKFLNDDGTLIKEFQMAVDSNVVITTLVPEEPVKAETEDTRYLFKYWVDKDGTIYYRSTIKNPTADTPDEVVLTAVYSEEDISGRQSFWSLVESIFERINRIFEYFAAIFEW